MKILTIEELSEIIKDAFEKGMKFQDFQKENLVESEIEIFKSYYISKLVEKLEIKINEKD